MDALGIGGGRGGANTASDILFDRGARSHDYTCMLLDPSGRAVSQKTRSIPSFIGTLPNSVKAFLAKYPPETLAPRDIIISNDPWLGTGHLPG